MSERRTSGTTMGGHETERLSAYIDGELDAAGRAAVEAHLAECTECAAVLADLDGIVRDAGALEDRPPGRDLWPEIEDRLASRSPVPVVPIESVRSRDRRRFSFTMPQLAAAAVALIVLSGAAVWWAGPSNVALIEPDRRVGTIPAGPEGVPVAYGEDAGYSDALADLEQAFESSQDRLDPETVQTVERNLLIIDEAIRQTQEALEADPGSTFLYDHLERAQRQKFEILQEATIALHTSF